MEHVLVLFSSFICPHDGFKYNIYSLSSFAVEKYLVLYLNAPPHLSVFVCLVFGAGEVAYSGFIRALLLETAVYWAR